MKSTVIVLILCCKIYAEMVLVQITQTAFRVGCQIPLRVFQLICIIQYFTEANEADSWMNEKAGLASSQDYGKDEKSCQKLLAKHNALITDVESYGTVIEELATEGRRLIQNEHFDSSAIETRQVCCYVIAAFNCILAEIEVDYKTLLACNTVKPRIKEPVNFDFKLKCFLYNRYLEKKSG